MQQNRDCLNENIVRSIQNLGLGRRFTFQKDNDPKPTAKTMQEWLMDNFVNVLPEPELQPNRTSLEKPKNGCPPTLTIQPDRA